MKKTLGTLGARITPWQVCLLLIGMIVLALSGLAYAAGGGADSPRITFLGSNVELHVASPLAVTSVWGSTTFEFNGSPTTVWPGQKIAEGVLQIENRSPFSYGAYIRAEPQEVLGETYPRFDVKTWVGDTLFHSPKDIPAGATVEIRIEIFIPYGASPSSFKGLNVIVDAGPPPTETIAECSASGCG